LFGEYKMDIGTYFESLKYLFILSGVIGATVILTVVYFLLRRRK